MGYGPWDEYFVHQLPAPMGHVHSPDKSWSDRCYFSAHAPDGSALLTCGYGNFPNGGYAHGYAKVALADGRHWDLDVARKCVDDRGNLSAGALTFTCAEPLKRWTIELGPNDSGIEWELHYEATAPLWDLLPLSIRRGDDVIADMHHIKQPGRYTGWLQIDGERISVDGFNGGRDRTIGVRVSEKIDFWVWFEANFEDRAIEAWVFETADGTVQYVDGGFTFNDGRQSKRFVSFRHDIGFDGDRKRPTEADIVFVDEDGAEFRVRAKATDLAVNVYHGPPHRSRRARDGTGSYRWSSEDPDVLNEMEAGAVALDQLMEFELDGMTGHGIFELLAMGDGYQRYPNLRPLDLSFTARSAPPEAAT
ncbi:MAG: hypothetical protein NVSMB4_08060 [Acidimicrobiales bacterium]